MPQRESRRGSALTLGRWSPSLRTYLYLLVATFIELSLHLTDMDYTLSKLSCLHNIVHARHLQIHQQVTAGTTDQATTALNRVFNKYRVSQKKG